MIAAYAASMSRSTRWIPTSSPRSPDGGDLGKVLDGVRAAQAAGLKIKINAVALKGFNDTEIPEMLKWAHGQGMDMTVIETMPMGEIDEDRTDQYMPLSLLRANIERQFTLEDIPFRTGGPCPLCDVSRRPAASSASLPR